MPELSREERIEIKLDALMEALSPHAVETAKARIFKRLADPAEDAEQVTLGEVRAEFASLKAKLERVRAEATLWANSPEGSIAPTRGAGHLFLGLLDVEES